MYAMVSAVSIYVDKFVHPQPHTLLNSHKKICTATELGTTLYYLHGPPSHGTVNRPTTD